MSQPYVGEIRLAGFNFAPSGWLFCDGSLLPIAQYDTLFQLIGTTYGGNGQTTFALPDLRGRVPIHQGLGAGLSNALVIGQTGGAESVRLSVNQIPIHIHPLAVAGVGGVATDSPAAATLGSGGVDIYAATGPTLATMATIPAIDATGGSQDHENRQPTIAINYIISMFGIFPSPP